MIAVIERLQEAHARRLRARKELFRYIRENKDRVKNAWLLRKMRLNYLGDLSDEKLIAHVQQIMQTEVDYEKENSNTRLPVM